MRKKEFKPSGRSFWGVTHCLNDANGGCTSRSAVHVVFDTGSQEYRATQFCKSCFELFCDQFTYVESHTVSENCGMPGTKWFSGGCAVA